MILKPKELREEIDIPLWKAKEFADQFDIQFGHNDMISRFDAVWGVGWIQIDFWKSHYAAKAYLRDDLGLDREEYRVKTTKSTRPHNAYFYYVRDGDFPNWDLIDDIHTPCENCQYIRNRKDTKPKCPNCGADWQDNPYWVQKQKQNIELRNELEAITDPRLL